MTALSDQATRLPDGWSRDSDGKIRLPGMQAFQLFGAFLNGDRTAIAYALNLRYTPGMHFPDFLDANDMDPIEAQTQRSTF
jgi:hypothetical protein